MKYAIAPFLLVLTISCPALADSPKRPNMLFIVADDLVPKICSAKFCDRKVALALNRP
jgi:hypothetical protein